VIALDAPTILPLGDSSLVVRFGDRIDPALHRRVMSLAAYLDAHPIPGIVEYVPAFASLAIHYDPLRIARSPSSYELLVSTLQQSIARMEEPASHEARIVEIPVCYGGEFGPDLEYVAAYHRLSIEEVISLHSGGSYRIYMIGFAPGFPYLGGMNERIATPRRSTPRSRVPAGSVAIGGMQTGVYPIESPGGWHLIGRTPLRLFRPERVPPVLLRAGDTIRFRSISRAEFDAWKEGAT
jgi:inhibitor of KinA